MWSGESTVKSSLREDGLELVVVGREDTATLSPASSPTSQFPSSITAESTTGRLKTSLPMGFVDFRAVVTHACWYNVFPFHNNQSPAPLTKGRGVARIKRVGGGGGGSASERVISEARRKFLATASF